MKRRLILGVGCAVLLFILMISTNNYIVQKVTPFLDNDYSDISCYEDSTVANGFLEFDPVADKPVPGKSIFFHETSCFREEGAALNSRQACAVESAARMNPEMTVYVLFVSPSRFSNATRDIARQLLDYSNIKIRHIFPERYVRNTPLDDWYSSGALKKSRWPRSHMSDVLRYLTLWKYGGIYLDLDVVVTKSLDGLTNFAGAEDWDDVAAGVMGFGANPLGRRVADMCLRDLKRNFRGDVWGNNGPGVITRTLQKICSTKYTRDMTVARCGGFKVYPPSTFYPIHYKKWRKYFESKDTDGTMALLEQSKAVHMWNKLSRSEEVRVDSNVPYAVIARKHCPKVFSNCDKVF